MVNQEEAHQKEHPAGEQQPHPRRGDLRVGDLPDDLWHPMPQIVWQITNPQIAAAGMGLLFARWVLLLVSLFLINHFGVFGVHQVRREERRFGKEGRCWGSPDYL